MKIQSRNNWQMQLIRVNSPINQDDSVGLSPVWYKGSDVSTMINSHKYSFYFNAGQWVLLHKWMNRLNDSLIICKDILQSLGMDFLNSLDAWINLSPVFMQKTTG